MYWHIAHMFYFCYDMDKDNNIDLYMRNGVKYAVIDDDLEM